MPPIEEQLEMPPKEEQLEMPPIEVQLEMPPLEWNYQKKKIFLQKTEYFMLKIFYDILLFVLEKHKKTICLFFNGERCYTHLI